MNDKSNEELKKELRDSQNAFNSFFNQSTAGAFFMMLDEPVVWNDSVDKKKVLDYVFDHQRITKVNQVMLEQYKTTEEDFIGLTPKDLFTHDLEYGQGIWTELFDKGKLHIDTDERRRDGSQLWIRGDYECLYDSQGRITGHFGLQIDITERKLSQDALNKTNLLLSSTLDSQKDTIIFSIDKNYNYLTFNKAHSEAMKFTWNTEIKIGMNILDCITFDDERLMAKKNFDRALKGESHSNVQVYGKVNPEYYESFFNPIIDDKNEIIGCTGLAINITERKQLELDLIKAKEEIEKSEERYNLALNATKEGIFDWNLISNDIYYSPQWKRILGYNDDELPNDFSIWENLTEPEDAKKSWKMQQELINKQRDRFEMEFKMKHKNGHWVDILSRADAVFDEKGKAIRIVGTHTDITDRKKLENLMKERNQFLTKLNNSLESVVFTVDLESRNIEYVNNRVEAVFGYSPEECIGNRTRFLYPDKQSFIDYGKQMQNALQKNQEFLIIENTLRKKNGELFSTDITTSFLDRTKVVAVITDITDKKKAEQDLIKAKEIAEENESKFRNLFENSPIGKSMTGIDGSLQVNKSFCEIVGYSEEELAGQKWKEISYPEDIPLAEEKIQSLLNGETDKVIFEKRYIQKNGNIIWADVSVYLQRDKKNKPEYFITTIIDITERKHADEALRSSQEMLLTSQSVANICSYSTELIVTDIDKSQWECSPEFYKIFGIDETYPHTIEGWIGFLHPDYRKDVAAYHESVVLEKKSFNREYKIIRINDGVERWVHGTGELVYDKDGNPIRMHGAIQDITERKQAELALKESEWYLEKAQGVSKTGHYIWDLRKSVLTWSNEMFNICGVKQENGTPTPEEYINFVHEDDKHILSPENMEMIFQKPNHELQFKIIDQSSNEVKHINLWGETIFNKTGEPVRVIGVIQDITKQKNTEFELIEAKEKAEESDRLKSAFLTNMSHEIRTPMNGILGFTQLLKEPNLSSEEQESFIKTIERSGERLLNTINDIVDISKIESGMMNVNIQESNINEQMEFNHNFFSLEVEGKGIHLSYKNGLPDKEAKIKTDNEKVDGILTNLIKNAIKFTNEGSIDFGYEKKGEYLEFFVKDTGVGIPIHQLQYIFERFRQVEESHSRLHEGSGLGLPITKSYVEMLGGRIWVESEVGKGSTFYFTIPINTESKLS